jgi:hypothetical protein
LFYRGDRIRLPGDPCDRGGLIVTAGDRKGKVTVQQVGAFTAETVRKPIGEKQKSHHRR